MVWTVSVSVARQMFRIHCLPVVPSVPVLTATTLPQYGANFTLEVSAGQPFVPAFLVYGLSRTSWLSMPLPVELGSFGAPGCFNQTSSDVVSVLVLDGIGVGTSTMGIPSDPAFAGFTWFNQAAVVTPGANALDMLVTNAGAVVVGS